MKNKKCFKCGVEKELSEFYKHSGMLDGHLNKCKDCTKRDVQKNYRDNIDYYKDYERKRSVLPHRVKLREDYWESKKETGEAYFMKRKYIKEYKKKNPMKYKAKNRLCSALRRGDIKRKPCEVCGEVKSHGHHPDYNYPLDVIWLCSKHHAEEHRRLRRKNEENTN